MALNVRQAINRGVLPLVALTAMFSSAFAASRIDDNSKPSKPVASAKAANQDQDNQKVLEAALKFPPIARAIQLENDKTINAATGITKGELFKKSEYAPMADTLKVGTEDFNTYTSFMKALVNNARAGAIKNRDAGLIKALDNPFAYPEFYALLEKASPRQTVIGLWLATIYTSRNPENELKMLVTNALKESDGITVNELAHRTTDVNQICDVILHGLSSEMEVNLADKRNYSKNAFLKGVNDIFSGIIEVVNGKTSSIAGAVEFFVIMPNPNKWQHMAMNDVLFNKFAYDTRPESTTRLTTLTPQRGGSGLSNLPPRSDFGF